MQTLTTLTSNKVTTDKKDNGFTLIELSIVLVIISLIVGGVIGGRSLIESARLTSVLSEIKTLEAAYNTFLTQYDALPGDMKDAQDYWGTSVANGDGDRHINWHWGFPRETRMSLEHLTAAEIYNGDAKYDTPNSVIIPGKTIPEGPMRGSYFLFAHTVAVTSDPGNIDPLNSYAYGKDALYLFFSGVGYPTQSNRFGGILTTKQARSMDKKMDDDTPDTGKILVEKGASSAAPSTSEDNCVDLTPPVSWILDSDEADCRLLYQISR